MTQSAPQFPRTESSHYWNGTRRLMMKSCMMLLQTCVSKILDFERTLKEMHMSSEASGMAQQVVQTSVASPPNKAHIAAASTDQSWVAQEYGFYEFSGHGSMYAPV